MPFRAIHRVALNPTAAARPPHPSHGWAIAQAATPAAGRPQGALSATAGVVRRLALRRFAESLKYKGLCLSGYPSGCAESNCGCPPNPPQPRPGHCAGRNPSCGSPSGCAIGHCCSSYVCRLPPHAPGGLWVSKAQRLLALSLRLWARPKAMRARPRRLRCYTTVMSRVVGSRAVNHALGCAALSVCMAVLDGHSGSAASA